jgi:hypothetical protein
MLAIRKNFVFAILIVILIALLYGCVQDRSYLAILSLSTPQPAGQRVIRSDRHNHTAPALASGGMASISRQALTFRMPAASLAQPTELLRPSTWETG